MRAPGTIVVVLVLVASVVGCRGEDAELLIPSPLIGRWTTDDPRYVDRYLEITATSVNFGVGENRPQSYGIFKITAVPHPVRGTRYRIEYIDRDGVDYHVSFHLQLENDEVVLRLANQFHMVWRKTGP